MSNPRGMRVLVVDDQQSMRGLSRRQCLTRLGFGQVDMAPSAEISIELNSLR